MSVVSHIQELRRHRELLYMLAWKDIQVKYKQSIMGILWAILMPLLIVSAGVLVKYAISIASGKQFDSRQVATVSVKSIPWAFFVASVRFSSNSLIANRNLVTKIYFPKELLPFASILSQLVDFVVAAAALSVILGLAGVGVSPQLLWLPLLALLIVMLVTGLGTMLSAAALFFRDVKYIVELLLTFAIFFTPVFFEVEMFSGFEVYLLLNPVAPILEGVDRVVVHQKSPDVYWLLYSGIFASLLLVVAYSLFKRAEPKFAESI